MEKKKMNLYIIAGCNGAGKTTASFTVLPEMLGCREFVNADEIAAGLSPFNPEGVAIQAGRLMIDRIIYLSHCRISDPIIVFSIIFLSEKCLNMRPTKRTYIEPYLWG